MIVLKLAMRINFVARSAFRNYVERKGKQNVC